MSEGRLAGKVVLITGIGSGMGRVTAELFAAEGATVVGCGLSAEGSTETARRIEAAGGIIDATAPVDLSDRTQVAAWIDGAAERHGRIDVLYNNASMPKFGPFADQPVEDYDFTIRNELDLVWHACQLAWPHLAAVRGAIVNIASVAGLQGARALPQAAHAAAKGGVLALTRQLAAEGVAAGIRVNSVCPGVMGTPPILRMYEELGDAAPVASIVERTIDGRPGDPKAVAWAGLYLASDEATWVTGANIVVDGGAGAYM
ncbi:SDR family oxidoreductase [Gulosibacter macacae]|uniref:SDR family oxidoreductase n=1 Tax=Gulosibacter macacae TaxID=2488791 RepID=A0A3P3VSV3_9MICO|nr:SDR family NAD(P)-dependent oxidoreductase [Gulosibacter macacae]RRJ85730.1 SDR family oxidoreductase [Gulosibacter macacae]